MPGAVGLWSIFLAFLLIGATSVGGGVIAYLRNSSVDKHGWIDDPTFVRMLSISQSLPGLNATNMAILVGARAARHAGVRRGDRGDLPSRRPVHVRRRHGLWDPRQPADRRRYPAQRCRRRGRAGVGRLLAARPPLPDRLGDLVFVGLAAAGVAVFHLPVPYVLLGVGALALSLVPPPRQLGEPRPMSQLPALIGVRLPVAADRRWRAGGALELKTLVVDVHHWMSFDALIHLYSVGQLAPGPNMMVVAAIGERVSGPILAPWRRWWPSSCRRSC